MGITINFCRLRIKSEFSHLDNQISKIKLSKQETYIGFYEKESK